MSTAAPAAAPPAIAAVCVLLGLVTPVIAGVALANEMGIKDVAAALGPDADPALEVDRDGDRQDVSSPVITENTGDAV